MQTPHSLQNFMWNLTFTLQVSTKVHMQLFFRVYSGMLIDANVARQFALHQIRNIQKQWYKVTGCTKRLEYKYFLSSIESIPYIFVRDGELMQCFCCYRNVYTICCFQFHVKVYLFSKMLRNGDLLSLLCENTSFLTFLY